METYTGDNQLSEPPQCFNEYQHHISDISDIKVEVQVNPPPTDFLVLPE